MKLRTITEDEFEDLDSEDTFQTNHTHPIGFAIAIGSNHPIKIRQTEQQIIQQIEDKILDYTNTSINLILPLEPVQNPYSIQHYPTIQQKLQHYPNKYLGIVEIYPFENTKQILQQLTPTHQIDHNTIWVTNVDEILNYLETHNRLW